MAAAQNIMIIAGEVSGDLIGASLVTELKNINPAIGICGIGGDKMQSAGMEINFHIRDMAFMGFTEVIKHIPYIRNVQKVLLDIIKERKITLAVLIDYPGFNLNIAQKLKALGLKVIYYVSPQVWAWGSGRVKKIKKYITKMIVLFPFEEKFYRKYNVDVEFAGHPLLERVNDYNFISKDELFQKFDLDKKKELLLLMPGSRENEITKLLPEMLKAASKLSEDFNLQTVVALSANIEESDLKKKYPGNYKIIAGHTYDLLKYSSAGIIKSGTSTLEAALFELPMVIVYRTSGLTYLIGKRLIKLNNIGMVNIISGETVVPELIQNDVTSPNIYKELKAILSDKSRYDSIKSRLKDVKLKLGKTGASRRAAGIIYDELTKK